jgi:hypothetical protein
LLSGGNSLDGQRWVSCRPGFFLPVPVLSRLFRRLVAEEADAAGLVGRDEFLKEPLLQAPLRRPEAGVALSRPLHPPRRHLKSPLDCMRRKLPHLQVDGLQDRRSDRYRYKVMTLATHEFIRRFLMHVLPAGFHRIRHLKAAPAPKKESRSLNGLGTFLRTTT